MNGGVVYLVGAGPGDPGLITVRGAELLARADVVAYDRLVHPELLTLASRARLVDVGKRSGEGGVSQDEINELLVREAKAGNVVVRLKGGDPFVFGRGGEEAEFLADGGVPFEVVPGVTSAVAAPAYAGIPVTHREHASWTVLATGHEAPDAESRLDWEALARAPSAVFLMGLERIDHIADSLVRAGKPADTPCAVISWATWPRQQVVTSTIEKIGDMVATAEIEPPAVLVVGAGVSLADKLDWFSRRPLAGKRVFVTRTRAQAGRLATLLRDAGAEPLSVPAIKIEPPPSYQPLDEALADTRRFAWVAFTSANAVAAAWDRLSAAGKDARSVTGCRLAAVGPSTADALRDRGLFADLVPAEHSADGLVEALGDPGEAKGRARQILIPQAMDAAPELAEGLRARGWRVRTVPAYRTVVDDSSLDEGRVALDAGVDAVLFTSGSTVRSFVELWGKPPAGTVVCCIGSRTAAVAEELGVHVDAIAAEQTLAGLVAALVAVRG